MKKTVDRALRRAQKSAVVRAESISARLTAGGTRADKNSSLPIF